ncbi:MAG: hypothetical protein ACYC5K_12975, partial [Saccharofermentanales bacterium]
SRCQRYEFRRIPVQSIIGRLELIAGADSTIISKDALQLIARLADGALRDAISLLDQAKGSFTGPITKDNILSLVGMVNDDFMYEVALSIVDRSPAQILGHIEKLVVEGRDVSRFTIDLVAFYRNVMVCLVAPDPASLLSLSDKSIAGLRDIASRVSLEYIIQVIRELSSLSSELKWSLNPRITLEVALIRLMESIGSTAPQTSGSSAGLAAVPAPTVSAGPPVTASPDTATIKASSFLPAVDGTASSPEQAVSVPSAPKAAAAAPVIAGSFSMQAAPAIPDSPAEEAGTTFSSEESPAPSDVPSSPAIPTSPVFVEPAISMATLDINDIWPKTLDTIVSTGQMTVYLFLLPGKPSLSGDSIRILFEDKDELNFREISSDKNIGIIRKAVQTVTGGDFGIQAVLSGREVRPGPAAASGEPSQTDDAQIPFSGIEALKKSAGELGIAFCMEE